jgi:transglutaminase-like putative cysteine protease
VATPVAEVMEHRRGVCQDFAHVAIAGLRGLGLAARYVSGYLETEPPPGEEKQIGSDASHAWFSAYDPDLGWLDFDPTNNQRPGSQHVTTAWGRDYSDITPLKGVIYGGGRHTTEVSVDVRRLD